MEERRMETTAGIKTIFGDIFPFEEKIPIIKPEVFIAPGAKVIGDIVIGSYSNVWFNSVLRGDVNYVRIGEYTNIQDGSVLHVSAGPNPLIIGNYVTVGHAAVLHSCKIEDITLIGMGSTVLDGAIVREKSMVAAGSLVKQGFEVPSGKLVGGVPAKIIRDLSQDELNYFHTSALNYFEYSKKTITSLYKVQNEKS